MKFRAARGPVSASVPRLLSQIPDGASGAAAALRNRTAEAAAKIGDILAAEDLQLALCCLYELHYSGLDGADEG